METQSDGIEIVSYGVEFRTQAVGLQNSELLQAASTSAQYLGQNQ